MDRPSSAPQKEVEMSEDQQVIGLERGRLGGSVDEW